MARKLTKMEMEGLYEYNNLILDLNHYVFSGTSSNDAVYADHEETFKLKKDLKRDVVHYTDKEIKELMKNESH